MAKQTNVWNPRVQETLDSLGGNKWFSVLDQGKAYHQGFVHLKLTIHNASEAISAEFLRLRKTRALHSRLK